MTKISFNFDDGSLRALSTLQLAGGYKTMAEVVCDALRLKKTIDTQIAQGFNQIVCRNSQGEERILSNYPDAKTHG